MQQRGQTSSRNVLQHVNSTERILFARVRGWIFPCALRDEDKQSTWFKCDGVSRRANVHESILLRPQSSSTLRSTLRGNGRSRTYEKSLSVRRTPARRVSFPRESPGFYGSHLRVGRDRECHVDWHVFTPRNNCCDRSRDEIIGVMCCTKGEVALEDWTTFNSLQVFNCNFLEMILQRAHTRRISGVFFNGNWHAMLYNFIKIIK